MPNKVYPTFKSKMASGQFNLSASSPYLMLVGASYTPSNSHSFLSDVTNELSSVNYTAGGKPLQGHTVSLSNETLVLDASNITFSGINGTFRYGVIWLSGGTPTTNHLLGAVDFGSTTVSNADFDIFWNQNGIFNLL